MSNQYRSDKDVFHEQQLKQLTENQKAISKESDSVYKADAFEEPYHTHSVYRTLDDEYLKGSLNRNFSYITKAKAQHPPYWDDERNCPAEMPLYQHNVSSGRYRHTVQRLSLTYNASFPGESLNKKLIDVKIVDSDLEFEPTNNVIDHEQYISQAFDNIVKDSSWAKKQHLRMVSDLINFGAGIYYFPTPESYIYETLDFRKFRFPSGTSTCPKDWEYLFVKSDMSVFELVNLYNKTKPNSRVGWNREALKGFLDSLLHRQITTNDSSIGGFMDTTENTEDVKEGFDSQILSKVGPVSVPLVTCFWKKDNGKVATSIFSDHELASSIDNFLYRKDLDYSFEDLFSVFPADETESEIRMVRGWGTAIYPLCHAYDRAFCKFLDHIDISSTVFMQMDPSEMHKKILHLGSMNVGEYDKVQNLTSALQPLIAALAFLDSKIDQITFSQGLNKQEMGGEGRGADLMNLILTMEGRVHKQLLSRFIERYTEHYKKVLRKVIFLALNDKKLTRYPEVRSKFRDYLKNRDVPKEIYQLDDESELNQGLPSSWMVTAVKPDDSGIASSIPHVLQALTPYLSTLPEPGFRYLLGRLIASAFGDEDAVDKALPGQDIAQATTQADLQSSIIQAAILTSHTSDFDQDLDISQESMVDPKLMDNHKFVTFPAVKADNAVMLKTFLDKAQEAVQRLQAREIGRTTLHIWLYNLISTANNHVNILRQDAIRSKRAEVQQLFEQYGQLFNMLRQVESQANADRAKRLDALSKQIVQQDMNDPARITAMAKLEESRAKSADIQRKYSTDQFTQAMELAQNRRSEEAHIVNQALQIKALRTPAEPPKQINQSDLGRPLGNEQRRE